jgi:peptidyl-prolyl cis-trans isomerase B (cyclophilin B)
MQRFLVHLAALAAISSPALAQPAAPAAPASTPAASTPAATAPAAEPQAAPTVLVPVKGWFAPGQPIEVKVNADGPVTLTLTDFVAGNKVEAKGSADVAAAGTTDVRKVFPGVDAPGTYLLYAVPKGKALPEFVGTPLVIGVRSDRRPQGPPGPMVVKVEPLRYVAMTTTKGPMTMAFYYDVAPNTATNFLNLAAQGFYNGLTFHRIIAGFMLQGGDPRGDGMGGPGYQIDAEFSDRPHKEGVLSMARAQDPNSAGSQFFVCLDYSRTAQLDRQYTAFGVVTAGLDTVKTIGAVKTNPENDKPLEAVNIEKADVRFVTPTDNPYPELQKKVQAK